MAENVGGIEYTIDANTDPLLRANKAANSSLDKTEKSLDKTGSAATRLDSKLKVLSSGVRTATRALRSGATVAAGLAVALTAATKVAATAGREIQQLSKLSNVGVERFQELSYGASQLGISSEKLGDIFKDVQDKIGDFLSTGGGELKDYFELIAPLVGQTAEEFRGLSGPDALIKFKEGLDAANISAGEQVFYLESLANDTAMLQPLLANSAQGFKDAAKEARDLNLVLSEAEVQELANVNIEFNKLLTTIAKLTQKIVAENGPQIRQAIQDITNVLINAAGYADRFFNSLSGGSELTKLENQASALTGKLEMLEGMTKRQFAIKVGTESTKNLIATQELIERLSQEYDDIQSDPILNLDIKAARLETVGEKISMLNGELIGLRDEVDKEYTAYVAAETDEAQQKLLALNGQISVLKDSASKPIVIEVTKGEASSPLKPDKNNPISIFDTEDGKLDGNTVSPMNAALQDGLGVTEQMADQIETLDAKFQNLGSTISDTLVGSALTFGDTIGNAFAQGIADGDTMNDTLKNIFSTISQQVLGSLVSLGAQYVVNAGLQAAGISASESASSAAIAANTTAGVAAAATLASAYAPAAAAASIATAGGAAVSGGTALASTYALSETLALAGGRVNGGGVSANSAYQVTENGKPEMLTVGGKNILLTGSQGGKVTSNSDLTSGSGGGTIVNVYNNSSSSEATQTQSTKDGKTVIDIVVADLNGNGKISKAITSNTTANYKAR